MEKRDLFSFRLDLLKDEISTIQAKISSYDDLSFKIKGWAITLWVGVVGFTVNQQSTLFLLAAIPVLAAFWLLDAYFKSFQQRSMARMGYIESFINGSPGDLRYNLAEAFEQRSFGEFIVYDPIGRQTCKIDDEFGRYFKEKVNYKKCLWIRNVRTLYLILIILSLLPTFGEAIYRLSCR